MFDRLAYQVLLDFKQNKNRQAINKLINTTGFIH